MVMLAGSAVFVPALSVTVTVKVKVPLVVGVPESPVLHHTPLRRLLDTTTASECRFNCIKRNKLSRKQRGSICKRWVFPPPDFSDVVGMKAHGGGASCHTAISVDQMLDDALPQVPRTPAK